MTKARQLIDEEEDDDLVSLIRQRAKRIKKEKIWAELIQNPEFSARVQNPRKARRGDIVKIYTTMKGHGDINRVAVAHLVQDAFEDESGDRTVYAFQPLNWHSYVGDDVAACGYGHAYWRHEPSRYGVQKVEIVGTSINLRTGEW